MNKYSDTAADAGVEVFCLDAGWHRCADGTYGYGDWIVDEKKYRDISLESIVESRVDGDMLKIEFPDENSAILIELKI